MEIHYLEGFNKACAVILEEARKKCEVQMPGTRPEFGEYCTANEMVDALEKIIARVQND